MEIPAELLDYCPLEYREQVLSGELEVLPGQKYDKPVIRWAGGPKHGQLVKGSGRFPRSNDIAAISKATAPKRTKTYQEAMNLLMDVDAGPDKPGSFAWWYEQAMVAAEGSPTNVKVPCLHEGCEMGDHETMVSIPKKDGNIIFKLLELKHGKAKETKEIDINQRQMIELMETRQVVVQVYSMDATEALERKRYVEGLIEGDFREVEPTTETQGDLSLLPPGVG